MLKIDYESPRPIRLNVNVQEQFPGKDESNITSVLWSFKTSVRQNDDAILLKDLDTGVVKENSTLENGAPSVRLSLVLDSIDWGSLSIGTYLMGVGIKFDTDPIDSDHHEIVADAEGGFLKIQIRQDLLRG